MVTFTAVAALSAAFLGTLLLLVQRHRRKQIAAAAEARHAATARQQDADERVTACLRLGWTPDAIRGHLRPCGGPRWHAAVERALARLGPTGTVPSTPSRARRC